MYKKYKRLVYTSPNLLAGFCKVNLSNAKTSASFVFQEFVFPGLIYCDQEPLWLCYFLGVHIRLLTRCKIKFTLSLDCLQIIFSLKSLSLSLKMSHKCALKLTDLWKTILLFYLNYKFELIGASLLALATSIYYINVVGISFLVTTSSLRLVIVYSPLYSAKHAMTTSSRLPITSSLSSCQVSP